VSLPTNDQIRTHFARGGLWRIVAPLRRPIFTVLGIVQGRAGDVATYDGGDLAATVEGEPWLRAAEWIPVDSRGDKLT
jgi:hypothetical protein